MGVATFTIFLPVPSSPKNNSNGPVLGTGTKVKNCRLQGALPDPDCTPGVALSGITAQEICSPEFSASQETSSTGVLEQLYFQYSLIPDHTEPYYVDHLISLSLGGSDDMANLWPQRTEPRPGYNEKNRVEKYLHEEVCSGRMSLESAQQQVASNWIRVFLSMPSF
jgi:hypothetical protein